jgi:Tfp pilus tip-associated adhesin PilY1
MKYPNSKPNMAVALSAALALGFAGTVFAAQIDLNQQPVAGLGPVGFSDFDLTDGASTAYRGDYALPFWSGDLVSYVVSSNGNVVLNWRARSLLEAKPAADRIIFTSRTSGTGKPFRWGTTADNGLSAAQRALVNADPVLGDKIVNYLRGDTANERTLTDATKLFRRRLSPLGAIIHSRPVYWLHGRQSDGAPIASVYVGANDGMLHAFDANTGEQKWAYAPAMLIGKTKDLSNPTLSPFPYLVDGLHVVAKTRTGPTMLVGGLGAGARGVYGLDIGNHSPASETEAAGMAKYEITNSTTGFGNLGHVYGAPKLVTLEDGTSAALIPNGVNSTTEHASLFVINTVTGALLAEIVADSTTGSGNGLMGVAAIDTNGNGRVDRAYAGDLKGTLWRFSLTNLGAATATAVFTPTTATARPITVAPSVIAHPDGGYQINFGTGKALEASDATSLGTDYLYGIWDNGSIAATGRRLTAPTLTGQTQTTDGTTVKYRTGSNAAITYGTGAAQFSGWRIDLPLGERLLGGDTFTRNFRYVITTNHPVTANAGYGGWMMQINALTGAAPDQPFFDLNSDGRVDFSATSLDRIDSGNATLGRVAPVGRFLGTGTWSQPVLVKVSEELDVPYFNFNPNDTVVVPPPQTTGGISNGHFDFDIFYNSCRTNTTSAYRGTCSSGQNHTHEYDDKYNVVGVNMLNASEAVFNLVNAIPNTATGNAQQFKLLFSNTNWSPATVIELVYRPDLASPAQVTIKGVVTALKLSPEGFLAVGDEGSPALVLTRPQMVRFEVKWPVDAFESKAWNDNFKSDVRAGLIPTQTGCVRGNVRAQGSGTGPWMNAAFTVQVVDASTSGTDIEATNPAPPIGADAIARTNPLYAGGYRLKKDALGATNFYQLKQLAQYTAFWHHPNGRCFGDAGWIKNPPQDTGASSRSTAKAPGSSDPTEAFFSSGSQVGGIGGGGTSQVVIDGRRAKVTFIYDTTTNTYLKVTTFEDNGEQRLETVVTGTTGSSSSMSSLGSSRDNLRTGRLSWREVIR